MRVTIIRDDGVVGVDGVFRQVDLSDLPEGVRAVQWYGDAGHVEMSSGLNLELQAIGDFQAWVDAWMAAAPPPPSEPTPAELIAAAHDRINAVYTAAVKTLTAGYPDMEIASWPKQEAEARAWAADNNASTPWIDAATDARGITRSVLAEMIIFQADAFAPLHAALTGKRQALRDAIDALGEEPTQEQLDAIQW